MFCISGLFFLTDSAKNHVLNTMNQTVGIFSLDQRKLGGESIDIRKLYKVTKPYLDHRICESLIDSVKIYWAAPSEFGTYRLCEQRRFRRACASAQSRQNLRCSLIQAVSQEEPSDRKPDPWLLWMAGHAQLKFVMTECSKTQIRLTGPY